MEYKIIARLEYSNDEKNKIYAPNRYDFYVDFSNVAVNVCVGVVGITFDISDDELKELAKKIKAFRIREGDDISIDRYYSRCSNSHTIFISVNGEIIGYFEKEWSR